MKNSKSQLLVLLLSLGCLLSGAYAQLTPSAYSYTNAANPTVNFGAKTLHIGVEGAATDIGVYGAGSGTSIEGTGSSHAGVWPAGSESVVARCVK